MSAGPASAPSSLHRYRAAELATRSIRVSSRTHRCRSTPSAARPGDDPDMAERRHQVGQERDPLILVGARRAARRLGKQRLGEVAQVDGLLRRLHQLVHQRMSPDERQQRRRRRPPPSQRARRRPVS